VGPPRCGVNTERTARTGGLHEARQDGGLSGSGRRRCRRGSRGRRAARNGGRHHGETGPGGDPPGIAPLGPSDDRGGRRHRRHGRAASQQVAALAGDGEAGIGWQGGPERPAPRSPPSAAPASGGPGRAGATGAAGSPVRGAGLRAGPGADRPEGVGGSTAPSRASVTLVGAENWKAPSDRPERAGPMLGANLLTGCLSDRHRRRPPARITDHPRRRTSRSGPEACQWL
jgi:hypothetical protein